MTHAQVLDMIGSAKYIFVKTRLTKNGALNDHVRIDDKEAYRLVKQTEANNMAFGWRQKPNYNVSACCLPHDSGSGGYLFSIFLGGE